jgi:hypothetical protein
MKSFKNEYKEHFNENNIIPDNVDKIKDKLTFKTIEYKPNNTKKVMPILSFSSLCLSIILVAISLVLFLTPNEKYIYEYVDKYSREVQMLRDNCDKYIDTPIYTDNIDDLYYSVYFGVKNNDSYIVISTSTAYSNETLIVEINDEYNVIQETKVEMVYNQVKLVSITDYSIFSIHGYISGSSYEPSDSVKMFEICSLKEFLN